MYKWAKFAKIYNRSRIYHDTQALISHKLQYNAIKTNELLGTHFMCGNTGTFVLYELKIIVPLKSRIAVRGY